MQDVSNLKTGVRDDIDILAAKYINGVYVQMMLGVMVTALVGYALLATGAMYTVVTAGGQAFGWGVFAAQFGTLLMFRPMMQRASGTAVRGLFAFYAALTGVTVGYAGLIFTAASILNVFFMAALAFGGLAAFGHVTKRNLGVIGTFCIQALMMLFGFSLLFAVAGMFPAAAPYLPAMNITLGLVGILVFSGLTAYESQKLRTTALSLASRDADGRAIALYTSHGALMMYLNFINLFFSLLRLFGRRR